MAIASLTSWAIRAASVAASGQRAVGQLLLQHLAHERDAGKVLTEPVMQVLPDSHLLALADVEHGGFEHTAIGDVEPVAITNAMAPLASCRTVCDHAIKRWRPSRVAQRLS